MHEYSRARILLVAACALWACGCGKREASSVEPLEQQAVTAAAPPAEPPAATPPPAAAPAAPAAPVYDGPDWESVKLVDDVPLCVFADYAERGKAPFLKDVRKQTLHANSTLIFGAFAPGCPNEACDAIPTLQCWVTADEPNTLVVHSKLTLKHKRGTACTEDCRSVTAGCETKELKAGKYTVQYGARTFSVRLPSVTRSPCFKLE